MKKHIQYGMRCPYCGRPVQLRPASYVYENDLDPENYLYVCNGFPNKCNAYVSAHRKSLKPMGTLADSELRHKRIEAHRALDRIWQEGFMTRHGVYKWLAPRLGLPYKDVHIAKLSDYYCNEVIRECEKFIKERHRKGGGKCV